MLPDWRATIIGADGVSLEGLLIRSNVIFLADGFRELRDRT
jgi:hypothetical protein